MQLLLEGWGRTLGLSLKELEELLCYGLLDRIGGPKLDGDLTARYLRRLGPYLTQIYRERLSGVRSSWPQGIFFGQQGRVNARHILKYLFEQHLKLGPSALADQFSYRFLEKYKITALVRSAYGGRLFAALDDCYPGHFKPWELRSSRGFWQGEKGQRHAVEALRWLVEEKLRLDPAELPEHITTNFLIRHGLKGALVAFGRSLWRLVDAAYPGRFRPWQFRHAPRNYWQGRAGQRRQAEALRELLQELGVKPEEFPQKVRWRFFVDHGIKKLISPRKQPGETLQRLVRLAFPDYYRPTDGLLVYDKGRRQIIYRSISRKLSREEIIEDLRRVAAKLGRAPKGREYSRLGLYTRATVARHFGSYWTALEEAGLSGFKRTPVPREELLRELRELAEKLGRAPRKVDIERSSRYSVRPFYRCFGSLKRAVRKAMASIEVKA